MNVFLAHAMLFLFTASHFAKGGRPKPGAFFTLWRRTYIYRQRLLLEQYQKNTKMAISKRTIKTKTG